MRRYEELRAAILRRKRERWLKILAAESPGPSAGTRPRDAEQETILLRMDRARLAKRDADWHIRIRRLTVD